jgi:uncharacterized protein
MIREIIITTLNPDGQVHIAPMGIRQENDLIVIAPFKPSTTLENLKRTEQAVVNMTDDVRIFAGCLTGRFDWPTVSASKINGKRLQNALGHLELEVRHMEDDNLRPAYYCEIVYQEIHKPFLGLNRAKSAVLEAAILVSRLHMLPTEKIDSEIKYLEIAINKTAGEEEQQAWDWLMERITEFRKQHTAGEGVV